MMEKRFTYEYDEHNGNLFDNECNTFYPIEDSETNIDLLCNRLNKIVKENEQLKSKNRGLQSELQIFKEDLTHSNLQINKLIDENEQLKIDKQNWYRQDSKIRVKLHQLKEENEQLDNRVKDLEELNRIYVDFLVCEGYELADVMKGDVE